MLQNDATARSVPWITQSYAVAVPYLAAGGAKLNDWRPLLSLPTYQAHFLPPEERMMHATLRGTRERIIGYMLSGSGMAVQPKDVQEKVAAQIGEVLDRGDGLVWLDKENGEFEQPFTTLVTVMRRKE